MKWWSIPGFLWPVIIKYYANRVIGIHSSVVISNWVYFLRVALPVGITIKKEGNHYRVYHPGLGHSVLMRPNSSDVLVYLQIFFNHEYAMLSKLQLPDRPVVVDLGANAGFFMLLLKLHWRKATILCVEPDTGNCNQIKKQIEANQLQDVVTVQAGVWVANESLKITSHPNGLEWGFEVSSDPSGDIQGLAFRKLLADHAISHVDLLKMDIEGTEEVLFEDTDFLEKLEESVSNIIMETHHIEKQRAIAAVLVDHNFEVILDRELIVAIRKSI